MADTKWDKLPYTLKTPDGERSLVITSHFQAVKSGWFDTGQYTVTEDSIKLGDIFVDLYTDDGFSWNGKPDEFTEKQLDTIVSYISFFDFGGADPLT